MAHKTTAKRKKRTAETVVVTAESALTDSPPSLRRLARRINLNDLDAVRREAARVYRLVRFGQIPAEVGTRLSYMLQTLGRLTEVALMEKRLAAVEARLGASGVLALPAVNGDSDDAEEIGGNPDGVVE